jgi:hypothetical protein
LWFFKSLATALLGLLRSPNLRDLAGFSGFGLPAMLGKQLMMSEERPAFWFLFSKQVQAEHAEHHYKRCYDQIMTRIGDE